jgi:hypothetical protein
MGFSRVGEVVGGDEVPEMPNEFDREIGSDIT